MGKGAGQEGISRDPEGLSSGEARDHLWGEGGRKSFLIGKYLEGGAAQS